MHTCRTSFQKNIITEFVPPADRKSRKVMIFCSGVPSTPCKDEVLWFWASKNYWTFFPRYRGSWESGGTFLQRSPEADLLAVISGLEQEAPFKDFWSAKTFRPRPESITVVGSSFGGPAAILASRDPRVTKAIGISPVVDWTAENRADPLDNLYNLIREAYGPAYRLNKKFWDRLANGNFYNPAVHIPEIDGRKVLIFHARDDKIVRFKPVAKFAAAAGCGLVDLKKGGHLSSAVLARKKYYPLVKKFLRA